MTNIHLNLNNFNDAVELSKIFPDSDEFEFTTKKIFRRKERLTCQCGKLMRHNGWNYARKNGFGHVRIGKQRCECGCEHIEDKQFWKNLLAEWKETLQSLFLILRDSDVAWRVVSIIMDFIQPCSKDKAHYFFNDLVEKFEYPQDNYLIVNYDEQHPKKGRAQKYRLTLLNYETKSPIADELFDNKNEETIRKFLRKHLDTDKELIIITDCDRRYPQIFKKIWGNKLIHQKCLLHLNKLVSNDFGKNLTILNFYNKYSILNIFYNRNKELKFLKRKLKKLEEKVFTSNDNKQKWIKKTKQQFYDYIRELEKERRRNKKNLTQRKLSQAKQIFDKLCREKGFFPKKIQERLKMIKKNWKYLTAFYSVKDCPATNNAIENFYSTSLKTDRKKQFRTNKGLKNHMKISAIKRIEGFAKPKKTLLEIFATIKLVSV